MADGVVLEKQSNHGLDIHIMQYNYRIRYVVTMDNAAANCSQSDNNEKERKFFEHETCKFNEPSLTLKLNEIFLGKSRNCRMTAKSRAYNPDFDGITLALVFG